MRRYTIVICDIIKLKRSQITDGEENMKKIRVGVLCALLAAVFFSAEVPENRTYAAEQQSEEQTPEKDTEEETEYPESYYLPIESDAVEGWPAGPKIEGESAVLMDTGTGAFLYSKNMMAKEYPASITKIMTTLIALENGNLDSKVKFSDWAVDSLEEGSSRLWMNAGEKLTLRQALYGVMLESANDCANAVAEKIGGSEEKFAELMNQKAAELGCVNTHFVNAHGLHNENHYTCAYDMALITKAALENETFVEIMKTVEYIIPKSKNVKEEHVLVNHHKMLYAEGWLYKGCSGGKPGFTEAALNTLVTVAKRKDRQLVCVIMRTNGPEKIRRETKDILDYGFKNFTRAEIPVSDAKITRSDVMKEADFGKVSVMKAPSFSEKMMFTKSSALISIPKKADTGEVKRAFIKGNLFSYSYHGWQVGVLPVTFNGVDMEVPEWKLLYTDVSENLSETQTETEAVSFGEKAGNVLKTGWSNAWEWIYDHDIAAALVGLVLILLLLPMLMIAYVRNRSSQRIRKQRQKEREERIRIEKDIDSKSVSEIEAELRAELEKEVLEQKKKEQEEEKKELKENIKEEKEE